MIDYAKFGRNYELSVQLNDATNLIISPPFTIEFDVTRSTQSSTNVASIRVYNLSQQNRDRIRKDVIDFDKLRDITLKAGYGDNLPTVFSGNITQAWSVREGNNFITQIESFDGGFAVTNGLTAASFPAQTPQSKIIESVISDLKDYGVTLGAIGNSFSSTSGVLGTTYSGNSCEILSELCNGQFFIDNGLAFVLANNECRQGTLTTITPDAGLLNTPVREENLVTLDMLFEPRIVMGQLLTLKSVTDPNLGIADLKLFPNFNGNYKVCYIKHRGMISQSVCGDAITSIRLDASAGNPQVVTSQ